MRSLKSWLGYAALTTHNDTSRHWRGYHGVRAVEAQGEAILRSAMASHADAWDKGEYLDCHAWQFTPSSFHEIARQLFRLGLSALDPVKVFATLKDRNEFCVILERR